MEKNTDTTKPRGARKKINEPPTCKFCSTPLTDLNWSDSLRKLRRYSCRPCWTRHTVDYANSRPGYKKEKVRRMRVVKASWSPERKAEEKRKAYARSVKRKYGITLEDLEIQEFKQNGKCAICSGEIEDTNKGLHVDHCHKTNVVRGLLCSACNMMIGIAKDSIEILESAVEYLKHGGVMDKDLINKKQIETNNNI